MLAQEVSLPGQQILHSVALRANFKEVKTLKTNPDFGLFFFLLRNSQEEAGNECIIFHGIETGSKLLVFL